jgi:hypothetical protein
MVKEVSGLLDVMEDVMDLQRAHRLDKLKPPSWLRQNWFLTAQGAPCFVYAIYSLAITGDGFFLVRYAAEKILDFFKELLTFIREWILSRGVLTGL